MPFSYELKKRFSAGNRVMMLYALTDVQDDNSSILRTPFKKITGYLIEGVTTGTTTVRVVSTAERQSSNNEATITLDAGTTDDEANILVVGLL